VNFPSRETIKVLFGHPAYQVADAFKKIRPDIDAIEVRTAEEFAARIGEADVVVCSGFWKNDLLPQAKKLRLIQSISAGVNQYDAALLKAAGVRLASAQGANKNAVSDHTMSLILAMARRLPEARDNQHKRFWRPMQSNFDTREDELAGKTLVVVGVGAIGARVVRLAKAFEMTVIGVRRDVAAGAAGADEIHSFKELHKVLPRADFVALNCPLTDETRHIIDETALALFKPSAYLINLARGGCVDEPALISALKAGRLRGAALDCTDSEPLPETSELWAMPNVFITPHTGGETVKYENNIAGLLATNLDRLWAGETALANQIV
jgi:phosphoglycerate dehydrogenase-like enzyme